MQEKFITCPVCGKKTRDVIREDTIIKNFPLFCPKCKVRTLINVEGFEVVTLGTLETAE